MSKAFNWISDKIRNQDRFGHKISLNHKGENTYKSFGGGCSTLFMFVFLGFIGVMFSMIMITKSSMKTNITRRFKNTVEDDLKDHYFMKEGRTIMLEFRYPDVEDVSRYLSYNLFSIYIETFETTSIKTVQFELLRGNKTIFPAGNQDERYLSNNFCIYNENASLLGDNTKERWKTMNFEIYPGKGANGAPEAEITSFIKDMSLYISFGDVYVDFKDINDPVKDFIQTLESHWTQGIGRSFL